jgi:hypothetical protein
MGRARQPVGLSSIVPTRYTDDAKPVVQFDPALEVSPFVLFRRFRDGNPPLLVDVRAQPAARTLRGSIALPAEPWEPPEDRDTVLFDEDGSVAAELAKALRERGAIRVRALFGGLELYAFALDPEVVGAETYLDAIR